MPNQFNLALLPDEDLAQTCIDVAQVNFANHATEYLLGEQAYPHVTLCQFQAEFALLDEIWSSVRELGVPPLQFNHIYIQPGIEEREGKLWVGLAVEPTEALLELQKAIYRTITELGVTGETPPESYLPHLTWARCEGSSISILGFPPSEIWQASHPFSLSLGQSNENGVYRERLYPQAIP